MLHRCGENDVVACVLERSEEASVAEVSRDNWSSPPSFNPFIYSGKVCLLGHEYDVKVLRDTGSDRTLYLNPNHGSHVSDTCVVLTGLGGPFSAQLVEAPLECDLFKGKAFVGVADKLPVKGVDVILGNDLCGMRVRPDDPIVSVAPIVETSTNLLESEFPYVFPLCAMTRSMDGVISRVKPKDIREPSIGNRVNASQELGDDVDMNDLSDTFFANLDDLSELSDSGASGLTDLQLHDEECKEYLRKHYIGDPRSIVALVLGPTSYNLLQNPHAPSPRARHHHNNKVPFALLYRTCVPALPRNYTPATCTPFRTLRRASLPDQLTSSTTCNGKPRGFRGAERLRGPVEHASVHFAFSHNTRPYPMPPTHTLSSTSAHFLSIQTSHHRPT
ncbi:hypothetical protein Pmani_028423 [Petrolisthes manimaculis]|uniref:Peptidase A2 domain-containing protein n=1 Tax=Petrolisthes manimaculis TaxID=1843537 RepID=A0AAE1P174_9EUCA|nr:hypothetical protein Pmani_028423 [Petrolisthes manimaculis]